MIISVYILEERKKSSIAEINSIQEVPLFCPIEKNEIEQNISVYVYVCVFMFVWAHKYA